jgi:hypothetical protein
MSEVRDDFLRLIRDKSKSPEEIYNEMYQKHKELYSTRQILRGLKSWDNCIYQGSIGENDFIMAEASATALDPTNIAMIHDDYKETIIKFIEHFRQEYDKNPNEHIINLTIIATYKVLREMFKGTTRNGDVAQNQRNSACKFDEERQFYKYKVSDQKKEGRAAVCCENNTTLGNIFQFIGFDTFHISGVLRHKDSGNAHAFVLIKYGIDDSKYALFDAFNGIIIRNVLTENYNLAKGFRIEHKENEKLD